MAIIENGNVAPFVRTGRNGLTLEITSHRLTDGRLLVTYRDITELKTHEQELERSRSTLQTVLDEMPDALLVYDADGKWLFFNEATLKFLNLDRKTLAATCATPGRSSTTRSTAATSARWTPPNAPSSSTRASRSSPRAPRAGCCSSVASTCCTSG